MKKVFALMMAAVMLMSLLAACGGGGNEDVDPAVIKIGCTGPLSGNNAVYGKAVERRPTASPISRTEGAKPFSCMKALTKSRIFWALSVVLGITVPPWFFIYNSTYERKRKGVFRKKRNPPVKPGVLHMRA